MEGEWEEERKGERGKMKGKERERITGKRERMAGFKLVGKKNQ